MKHVNTAILLFTVLWIFASCAKSSEQEGQKGDLSGEAAPKVTWYDFNEGIKMASEKKKPVVMDFYADWCGWCRKMDAEVFSDREVAAKLRDNYICIRLHTDKNRDETITYKNHVLTKQEFTMMLGIQGLPTVVFMDREGSLITKIPGFIDKSTFLPLLKFIGNDCYQKKVSFQDYLDGKVPCNAPN
jgi:thioredoxin-related protein